MTWKIHEPWERATWLNRVLLCVPHALRDVLGVAFIGTGARTAWRRSACGAALVRGVEAVGSAVAHPSPRTGFHPSMPEIQHATSGARTTLQNVWVNPSLRPPPLCPPIAPSPHSYTPRRRRSRPDFFVFLVDAGIHSSPLPGSYAPLCHLVRCVCTKRGRSGHAGAGGREIAVHGVYNPLRAHGVLRPQHERLVELLWALHPGVPRYSR